MSAAEERTILVFQGAGKYSILDNCVVSEDGPMDVFEAHSHAFFGKETSLEIDKRTNFTRITVPNKSPWKTVNYRGEYMALWEGPHLKSGAIGYNKVQYTKETPEQKAERLHRMQDRETSFPIDISKIEMITVTGSADVSMRVSRTHDCLVTQVHLGATLQSRIDRKKEEVPTPTPALDDLHCNVSLIVKIDEKNVEVSPNAVDMISQKNYFESLSPEERARHGKWAAVGAKRVLASGNDRDEVAEKARKRYRVGHIFIARNVPRGEDVKTLVEWFSSIEGPKKILLTEWVVVFMMNDLPEVLATGHDREEVIDTAKKLVGPGNKDPLVLIHNKKDGHFTEI